MSLNKRATRSPGVSMLLMKAERCRPKEFANKPSAINQAACIIVNICAIYSHLNACHRLR
jgi:hypothetical protein